MLHVKCFLIPVTYFLVISCSFHKIVPPPSGTIGNDTMQLILTDLTLDEAALNNAVLNDTVKKINVLAKYNVSLQRFDSSFAYYSQNPKILKEIYGKVLENLNKK